MNFAYNDPVAEKFDEIGNRYAHFDLDSAATVPEIGRFEINDIFWEDDRQALSSTLHQEWSDRVVLVAT